MPTGSITEECSRANPGGWGLSTESLLYWDRPPCITTMVSTPKGQGRIQFRRGTTADPDPVEYLYAVNYFNLLAPTNFWEIYGKALTGWKRNLDIEIKNTHFPKIEFRGSPGNSFSGIDNIYIIDLSPGEIWLTGAGPSRLHAGASTPNRWVFTRIASS